MRRAGLGKTGDGDDKSHEHLAALLARKHARISAALPNGLSCSSTRSTRGCQPLPPQVSPSKYLPQPPRQTHFVNKT